jgi:Transglutaminase-like superfamily
MSGSYFLSPHVHVCVAGNHVVLLDLERDKYLAVVPAHRLARWVRGWPVAAPESIPYPAREGADSASESGSDSGLLSKMLSQGLLVTDPRIGKEAVPVVTDRARTALIEFDMNVRPRASFAQLWNLFGAYIAAKWALKYRPIKVVVRAAGLRTQTALASTPAVDIGTARHLVTAFTHLRPLFFTAQDACLLDSLTLLNFLARYRIFPRWVFGVKADPFYAHCWLQQADFVFNDTPDYVRGFTPILVV